jgi:hypothetical protein
MAQKEKAWRNRSGYAPKAKVARSNRVGSAKSPILIKAVADAFSDRCLPQVLTDAPRKQPAGPPPWPGSARLGVVAEAIPDPRLGPDQRCGGSELLAQMPDIDAQILRVLDMRRPPDGRE